MQGLVVSCMSGNMLTLQRITQRQFVNVLLGACRRGVSRVNSALLVAPVSIYVGLQSLTGIAHARRHTCDRYHQGPFNAFVFLGSDAP